MIKLQINYKNETAEMAFDQTEILIGKSDNCDIKIKGWFIANEHAVIKRLSGGYVVEDLNRGANGTIVAGKKVDYYGPIDIIKEDITIGNYCFVIIDSQDVQQTETILNSSEESIHSNLHDVEEPLVIDAAPTTALKVVSEFDIAYKTLESQWVVNCRNKLVENMDLRRLDVSSMSDEQLLHETKISLDNVILELGNNLPDILDIDVLKKRVLDESIGLGPLEDLLADDSITEIMVNARDEIFVERSGNIMKTTTEFTSDKAVVDVIERIVSPLGRKIDESSPMVDARLVDGSRVNAIIPPLAIKGPSITIRKFPKHNLTVDDLIGFGSMTSEMADFLKICVKYKKNIIISGGTGSGKTTLLNLLSSFIPNNERVITIEDAAELRLSLDHLISLESRPSNSEGKGAIAIRELVKNSLRMRPDRIVIGECRGSETLDMLQAMNKGHDGSLTTLHSNNPRDAIARTETMVMMAGMDLPITAIRDQIASAVNIIVQQTRLTCGSRKITYISEVTGVESGKIQIQDIFRFHRTGFDMNSMKTVGVFKPEGVIPTFYDELRLSGIDLSVEIFNMSN